MKSEQDCLGRESIALWEKTPSTETENERK